MTVAIHSPGDQMYLIHDPDRKGFLIWTHGDDKYVMAFTSSDKAEEYNDIVMKHRPGDIVTIKSRDSKDFARKMVTTGVHQMIVDYPVINDQDFWDKHPFEIGEIPRELGRNYVIVDLRKVVRN